MSKKRYKKRKRQRADWAAIQAAGKKRSAWAKMGGTLLGGLATLATGGAAAPIVAALVAGGGTWLGSKLGDMAARTSREGRAEGTKWYGSQKAGLDEMIKEQIGADALKAGVMGGLGQMGGKLSFGKGGLKVGGEGVTKQNLLKSGRNIFTADKAALGNQKGLGRLLDFRGSQLGGGIEKLKAMAATHKENKLMEAAKAQYADIMKGRRVAAHQARVDQNIGLSHVDGGYRNTDFLSDAGFDKKMEGMQWRLKNELAETQGSYYDMLAGQDELRHPNLTGLRNEVDLIGDSRLSKFDQARKDLFLNQNIATDKYGQFQITHPDTGETIGTPKFMGKGGQIVEGEGFYKRGWFGDRFFGKNVMKPDAPNVPIAGESEFFDAPVNAIEDPGFSEFGNWDAPPPRPLEQGFESQFVDPMGDLRSGSEFQTTNAIDNLNLPSASDYSGRGSLYDNYQGYSGDSWPAETVKTGSQSGGSGFPELKNPFSSPFYSPTGGQFQPRKPKRNFYNNLFGGE